jgi:hypothetical protein
MRICEDIITGYDDDGYPIYDQQCYDDGSTNTYTSDDADLAGGLIPADALGTLLGKDNIDYNAWMKESMTPEAQATIQHLINTRADPSLIGKLLNTFKTATGAYDWAKIATAGAGLKSMLDSSSGATGGYNVPVPKMDMVRQQIQYTDPNRRPGEAGRQYFTDPRYVKQGNAESLTAAQNAANTQAQGILAAYKPAAAPPAVNPYAANVKTPWNPPASTGGTNTTNTTAGLAAIPTQEQLMDPNYKVGMASGGIASGRYLRGGTDGMADQIPSSIDGQQKAALSHGEFVIPADVVSHLGNGNSDAGADKLYQMMDRIRQARTGTKKQGKRINPDKFMPGGLAAAYSAGGGVKGFDGTSGSAVTTGGGVPLDTSRSSTLSPWAGDYVTNMLGKTEALTNAPMQAYGGPLTAGASNLQNQGFAGISGIAGAGYTPTTNTFDTAAANKYMNPYLQASLDPQLAELRRQAQIAGVSDMSKLTQAGGYGGGRQAVLMGEQNRNLLDKSQSLIGQGYNTAYDKAMAQFNADQGRGEQSRQFSADYGLKSNQDLLSAGATQRDIEAQGIAADKAQFEQQQAEPYNQLSFQRKMVEGLPIGGSTTAVTQDTLSKLQSDIGGLASLYKTLANLKIGG